MASGNHLRPIAADGVAKARVIIFLIAVLVIHALFFWLWTSQKQNPEIKKSAHLIVELGKAPPSAPPSRAGAESELAPQKSPAPKLDSPAPPTSKSVAPPTSLSPTAPTAPPSGKNELPTPADTNSSAPGPHTTHPEAAHAAVQSTSNKTVTESVRTTEPDYKAAYLNNPRPPYPRNAHRFGIEGTVILQAEVNEEGAPLQVRVFQSSGNDLLDESALNTVAKWRFSPARKEGVMIRAFVKIPITFSLKSPTQR